MQIQKLHSSNRGTRKNETVQTQQRLPDVLLFMQAVTIATAEGAPIQQHQNSQHMNLNTPGRMGVKYWYSTYWGGHNWRTTAHHL
jgi:hypothetical protein